MLTICTNEKERYQKVSLSLPNLTRLSGRSSALPYPACEQKQFERINSRPARQCQTSATQMSNLRDATVNFRRIRV